MDSSPEAFNVLFAEGFEGGDSPESGAATASADDPRAGIPFDRSDSLTARVATALAGDLDKNFSLRFAIADPRGFVKSDKIRDVYERELTARGFPPDNVAGATALLFIVAWELANGKTLSAADNKAVLAQVTTKLRGSPLERVDDQQRQMQADLRLLTAGLWLEEAYVRAPFPDQVRDLSDAVQRDMQKISNNDMRAQIVTATGFADQ